MRRPEPAELILGAAVAGVLAGDAWLVLEQRRRPELELVTDVLRRRGVLACSLYTLAHVLDVLGPLDAFRLAGRLLTRGGSAHA